MRLLIVLGVWVGASIPLALLAGRLLGGADRRFGLIDEIEAYLRRGRNRPGTGRSAAALVGAAAMLIAVALLGNEAVRQLPPAQVVVDSMREAVDPTPTSAPTTTPPTASTPADEHPVASAASEPPAVAPLDELDADDDHGARGDEAIDDDEPTTTTTQSTTTTTVADDDHGGKDRDGHKDDDRSGPSTTTTTEPPSTTTTTTASGSTPAGSTTTQPGHDGDGR